MFNYLRSGILDRFISKELAYQKLPIKASEMPILMDPNEIQDYAKAGAALITVAALAISTFHIFPDNNPSNNTDKELIIKYFTADPTLIFEEESAQLKWEVAGATSVSIISSLGTDIGSVEHPSGTREVNPKAKTSYTLIARNEKTDLKKSVTVDVTPFNIDKFSVSPESLNKGESATLSWDVSGARNVKITCDKGEDIGRVEATSRKTVTPQETTIFTLWAENKGSSPKRKEATVSVNPAKISGVTSQEWGANVEGNAPVVVQISPSSQTPQLSVLTNSGWTDNAQCSLWSQQTVGEYLPASGQVQRFFKDPTGLVTGLPRQFLSGGTYTTSFNANMLGWYEIWFTLNGVESNHIFIYVY